ncbi:MAG: hypothetical protein ACHQQ3_08525 [Gemmatimonadales bacterium]
MSGLLVGAILAFTASGWVLWPLLRTPLRPSVSCTICGPRPEADAAFCSNCGRSLARA